MTLKSQEFGPLKQEFSSNTLYIHDTFAGKKRLFVPKDPSNITFYACGPTVYDRIHVGNGRSLVVFDMIYRVLRFLYPKVTYVRNITDVDDKINAEAKSQGIPIQELTTKTTDFFHEDAHKLYVLNPTVEPKATDHISEMIELCQMLLDKKAAYLQEGHILFDVTQFPGYGQLSGFSWEDMMVGARVEVAPYKRQGVDFVLWKPSNPSEVGWESPWGWGRPGWHIECSAMSKKYLGCTFDIHGGGSDLMFPHHENERAQSCVACGVDESVGYWVHNGLLLVEGQKMSKSLGNFVTLNTVLSQIPGEVVRWAFLSSHYRHTLNWSTESLLQAQACVTQLYQSLRPFSDVLEEDPNSDDGRFLEEDFLAYLLDDINTPAALKYLQKMSQQLNKDKEVSLARRLKACGQWMGFLNISANQWFQKQEGLGLSVEDIQQAIEKRLFHKKNKDFPQADAIRQWLETQGIFLEDNADGTTHWKRNS